MSGDDLMTPDFSSISWLIQCEPNLNGNDEWMKLNVHKFDMYTSIDTIEIDSHGT